VVSGTQSPVAIHFTAYGDESDPGPYPVPAGAPIEGGAASSGDRHVLIIDRDHNRSYELDAAYPNGDGSWNAACGAVFQLDSNAIPPAFSTESRALLQAMKTYGLILADNGSNWYVSGAPDERWNNDALTAELRQVRGRDFEVLRMDGLVAG